MRGLGGVVVLMTALSVPTVGGAQVLPAPPAEMARLSWLAGEWEGSGWMEYAPGERGEFEASERVESRMGGRVLVVEGRSTAWMGPDRGDVPVHQALGVFSYDARSQAFVFRAWTARGGNGEAHAAEVEEGKIVWGHADPRGQVRYTITRTDADEWLEVGHISEDGGATWRQFFEMRLAKR